MPRIFQKQDNGLLVELPQGTAWQDQQHSRELMLEAIILPSAAEIAEHAALVQAAEAERQAALEAEQQAQEQHAANQARRAAHREAVKQRLGLTDDELDSLTGG